MVKVIWVHLQDLGNSENERFTSIPVLLEKLSSDRSNFYKWQKKEGFAQWWAKVIEDFHTNIGLVNVHNAIYRRSLGNSPQDAKVFLERFDDDYKPATAVEHKLPTADDQAIQAAIARSKARAAQSRKPVQNTAGEDVNVLPEPVEPTDHTEQDEEKKCQ